MANDTAQPQQQNIQLVAITGDLVEAFFSFTQSGGSDRERKFMGEKLQGQVQANLLEQYAAQCVAAAKQGIIDECIAAQKAAKIDPVAKKIDEALNSDVIVTQRQVGDYIETPPPPAWKQLTDEKVRTPIKRRK